jgi:hypothetical protein
MKNKRDVLVGIAVYRKEDWKRLHDISVDKKELPDTWKDWKHEYNKLKENFKTTRIRTIDIVVDIDELILYCKKSELKIDSTARSRFVADKVRLMQKRLTGKKRKDRQRSFSNKLMWAKKATSLDVESDEGYWQFRELAKKSGLGKRRLEYYSNAYEAAGESGLRALSYRKKMPRHIRGKAVKKIDKFISERIPEDLQSKIRLTQKSPVNTITVYERRPYFSDPSRWSSLEVFQVRYTDYDNRWHLYWMRVFHKWWPYVPRLPVYTIDDCIWEVDEDVWGCFWG